MLLTFLESLFKGKESVGAAAFGHKAALSLESVAVASKKVSESRTDEFSNNLRGDLE